MRKNAMTKPADTSSPSLAPQPLAGLWLPLLGPPAIWLVQFEANYALAGSETARRFPGLLPSISFVAAAIVVALALSARSSRRSAAASPLDAMAGVTSRNRFMATCGLMSASLFLLVIVAQGIATFFHEPGPG
jgi:hypothetical protein